LLITSGSIPLGGLSNIFDIFTHSKIPEDRDTDNYTPFYPIEHRYARQATNSLENMQGTPNSLEQNYRTGWPRMLCYYNDDNHFPFYGLQIHSHEEKFFEETPHEIRSTPYVFIAYTQSHFTHDEDLKVDKLRLAANVAMHLYNGRLDDSKDKRAYWLADLCMPQSMEYTEGHRKYLDKDTEEEKRRRAQLENSDVGHPFTYLLLRDV
jgi:hypothetical protein